MKIINKLVSKITLKRLNQIDYFRKNPGEVQNNMFFNLLNTAENTHFGKQYNFRKAYEKKSLNLFKKNVPLCNYEDIYPYINKIRKGDKNILWPTEIKWFAQSSGTTSSKSKFIPVSKESMEINHFRAGKDVICIYTDLVPETKVLKGKVLAIGGSQQINSFNNDQYYGDISAVLIKNLPLWANFLRTPNKATALMPEWEEKIETMAGKTIKTNVTNISGVPSWTLVLIKKIFEITGKSDLMDVWPNLELFVHGGVSFTPYREEYKSVIKSPSMNYLETYNASEGFFAIQDDFSSNDMLLMLDYGIFYEFIPVENVHAENPNTYTIEEVELNKNYAIVISTNGGLWRYIIGDTVIFTSKYPYKIKITGRIKHFINAFGEELIIDNAEKALRMACKNTKALIKEYTAAPIYMNNNSTGGHEWLIEFTKKPNDLTEFSKLLDDSLKNINSDYEAKRHKNMTLKEPKINIAKDGVFYKWLKSKGKLGGQFKIPRLSNNRDYIDELLKLNN